MKKIKDWLQKLKQYFYQEFWKNNRALVILLLIVALLVVIVRLRLLAVPFDRDGGEYAYMGQLILQGHLPYEEAYNLKMPGNYFLYALIMLIFGQSHLAIHFGFLLMNIATAFFLLLFLKNITKSSKTPIIAVIFFLLMSVSPETFEGLYAKAEYPLIFFAIVGLWLLSVALKKKNKALFFWGGFSMGTALAMKQNGFFLLLFGFIYLLQVFYLKWKAKVLAKRDIVKFYFIFIAGSVLPLALIVLLYLLKGEFQLFWFWVVAYAKEHALLISFDQGMKILAGRILLISTFYPLQVILFLIGMAVTLKNIKSHKNKVYLYFIFFSIMCILPGFYFSRFYFLMLLPAFCLLASIGVIFISNNFSRSKIAEKALLFVVIISILFPFLRQVDHFFSFSPNEISRLVYANNPYPESLVIGDYLRNNTKPSDKIAIFGSEPQIYFYSQRKSATGFLYMYSLMDDHKYAQQMQRQMIEQVKNNKPEYIIFYSSERSWRHTAHIGKILIDWYPEFLKENYEVVGLVDIYSDNKTNYIWEAVSDYKPKSKNIFWIYKRKNP